MRELVRQKINDSLATAVALELERRGAEIAYVRTANGLEVDFLARYPVGRPELIQVCADLDSAETLKRETRSLLVAAEEHPQASLHLVALTSDSPPPLPENVSLHSAATWLLAADEAR